MNINKNICTGKYRFGYQPARRSNSAGGGQFAEDERDETGFNAFEARLYDGMIGRWTTTDPAKQYFSPYLAMGNNPVNGVDPDGREWFINHSNGHLYWSASNNCGYEGFTFLGNDNFFGQESYNETKAWRKDGHQGHWYGSRSEEYASTYKFKLAPLESYTYESLMIKDIGIANMTVIGGDEVWTKMTYAHYNANVLIHSKPLEYPSSISIIKFTKFEYLEVIPLLTEAEKIIKLGQMGLGNFTSDNKYLYKGWEDYPVNGYLKEYNTK